MEVGGGLGQAHGRTWGHETALGRKDAVDVAMRKRG